MSRSWARSAPMKRDGPTSDRGLTGPAPRSGATDRTVENLVTVVGTDLAYTVDLEHMERTVDGERIHRVLRCTQIYRLEHGEWRITHRHADELITTR
jgi:ketosteroid isomerase-like protein